MASDARALSTAASRTLSSARRLRSSSWNSGSPGRTVWPTFTNSLSTTPGAWVPTAMFSVSGSTMPAPASCFTYGDLPGSIGGSTVGGT